MDNFTLFLNGSDHTSVLILESVVFISLVISMFLQIRILTKKQRELEEAILTAEEASRAKSDFLAKMSHDIRTPLNTILAMNEMIVSNTSSAKIREWINDSNVSGRILLSLIDDMLDLTRIEAGKLEVLEQPFDTWLLSKDITKMWQPQAQRAGLEFKCDVDPDVPRFLLGDEGLIRKIINNLLSNAIKYTREGSVGLKMMWDDGLKVEVSDTGIGIGQEHLESIFKPFERGVSEMYKDTSGSGLGLAIVKELTDALSGEVSCESILGEGTVFRINIPLKIYVSNNDESEESTSDYPSETTSSKQLVAPEARVLVVDDNPYNRKVIIGFLETALIQTDDVESGFEALEMIDIKDYDLVLMDLRMPKMDGAETLDRIKSEYPDFKAPIVVLTADIMNGVREQLLNRGFADFLSKPVSSAKLIETIARFIPEKIITLETGYDASMTLSSVERYQDMLVPYGIDLKLALENNAGNTGEFLSRAKLFEEYADEGLRALEGPIGDESYFLQIHSLKSVSKGVGADILSHLCEAVEMRKDNEFAEEVNPVILDEYKRVREGLNKLRKELESIQYE